VRSILCGTLSLVGFCFPGRPLWADDQEAADAKLHQRLLRSTVWVNVILKTDPNGAVTVSSGTGVLIDLRRRLVVTHASVVRDIDQAKVLFPTVAAGKLVTDRNAYVPMISRGISAKVIAQNGPRGLALLELANLPAGAAALKLAESVTVEERVHSVGTPVTGKMWAFRTGAVYKIGPGKFTGKTADGLDYVLDTRVLLTTISTEEGEGGGPLVNDQGELVAVQHGNRTMIPAGEKPGQSIFIDVAELKALLEEKKLLAKADPPAPGGDTRAEQDLKVTPVKLPATTLGCMFWADAKGTAFYALDPAGTIRKISFPDLKETQKIELGKACSWLAPSAEGLVVSVAAPPEVWLLDPDKGTVKKKAAVPSLKRAVSALNLSVAFASTGSELYEIDLKKGSVAKYAGPPAKPAGYDNPVVAPDGKYLFTTGDLEQMNRFGIKDGKASFEQASPRLAQGRVDIGIQVSPDSKFVTLPSGPGNWDAGKPNAILVFPVDNIEKAAVTLVFAWPGTMAISADPATGNFYAGDLSLFDKAGLLQKEYKLRVGQMRQMLVHPEGGKLLLLGKDKVLLVEVPTAAVRADDKAPPPKATNESLLGKQRQVDDLSVTEVKLDATNVLGCLCWLDDAKAFCCVEGTGVVHRIRLDQFKEEQRVDVGHKCSWLDVSAEGLVLTLPDRKEVWVLDATTLRVKSKIPAPGVIRAVSAPPLAVAFATNRLGVAILDLKAGKPVKQYGAQDLVKRAVSSGLPVVTPDGKYLLTTNGIEQLLRLKIDGQELKFDELGQRIAQGRAVAIAVSPDSSHVCLPTGGGNYRQLLKDHPTIGANTTYVYPITNINKPEFTVAQGDSAEAMGFDPKGGLVYAETFNKQLMVFDAKGTKQKEYQLGNGVPAAPRQFLVHPEGRKLLVLADHKLSWVELPKKDK
jgi:hypothetical protein